mmetsp:Transcript_33975/g.55139  ORF Transcript_33975/g.55139 Transcript_33975/m.55139 type:complete len:194 (-) Transcript_33975:74-655(-)
MRDARKSDAIILMLALIASTLAEGTMAVAAKGLFYVRNPQIWRVSGAMGGGRLRPRHSNDSNPRPKLAPSQTRDGFGPSNSRNTSRKVVGSLEALERAYGRDMPKVKRARERKDVNASEWLQKPGAYLNTFNAYRGTQPDSFGTNAWLALRWKKGKQYQISKKRFKKGGGFVIGGRISTEVRSIPLNLGPIAE